MQVKAHKTTWFDVEIADHDMLRALQNRFGFGQDYVERGFYYEWDYDHYHSGPQYKAPRTASEKELERYQFLSLASKLLR